MLRYRKTFIRAAREITRKKGVALFLDEIQCSLDQTGQWFAFNRFISAKDKEILTDMVVIAKISTSASSAGAVILNEKARQRFRLDSTAAINKPARPSLEYFRIIEDGRGSCSGYERSGRCVESRLAELKHLQFFKDFRGAGLMLAVKLGGPHVRN